jgi:hypothetical protein
MSVRPSSWNNSAPTGRKFYIRVLIENLSRKVKVDENLVRTSALHEDPCAFMTSRLIVRRMINISDKSCSENQNTHLCSVTVFPPENHVGYDAVWKNMV